MAKIEISIFSERKNVWKGKKSADICLATPNAKKSQSGYLLISSFVIGELQVDNIVTAGMKVNYRDNIMRARAGFRSYQE